MTDEERNELIATLRLSAPNSVEYQAADEIERLAARVKELERWDAILNPRPPGENNAMDP